MGQKSSEEPLAEPNTSDVSSGGQSPATDQSLSGDTEGRVYRPFDHYPLKWDISPEDE